MAEQAFNFRIIAQERVYLCMDWGFEKDDCIAKEVIREWDSGNTTPIMPWVRFSGDYIIELITLPTHELLHEMHADACDCATDQRGRTS